MARKIIVQLWVEIHHPVEETSQEVERNTRAADLLGLAQHAAVDGSTLFVVKADVHTEPLPDPVSEPENPIPTDGGDNGGDG